MTEQNKTKIPGPVYAAAGAGELVYQQLRKLPAVLGELDRDRLRELARRNSAAVAGGAQAAQEKAVAVYQDLVARGAWVIGRTGQTASADAELESEGAAGVAPAPAPTALPSGEAR